MEAWHGMLFMHTTGHSLDMKYHDEHNTFHKALKALVLHLRQRHCLWMDWKMRKSHLGRIRSRPFRTNMERLVLFVLTTRVTRMEKTKLLWGILCGSRIRLIASDFKCHLMICCYLVQLTPIHLLTRFCCYTYHCTHSSSLSTVHTRTKKERGLI